MGCMLLIFENRGSLMRYEAPVVWHFALPLMNNFNKTKLLFSHAGYASWGFSPFSVSLIYVNMQNVR